MKRILLALAVALLVAGGATASHAVEFGARVAYWFPDVSGSVLTTTAGVPETAIDLEGTLGVQDENFPFGEAFISFGNTTLRVGYTRMEFDGNRTLVQPITFNGTTFNVAETVVTRVDLSMLDASLQYDIIRPDVGVASVNLGLLFQVKYVDGEVQLTGTATGTTVENFQVPIPMIGAAFGVGIVKDVLRADIRGAGIGWSGNHLFDVDAYASFHPMPFLTFQGGYRFIDMKFDEAEILASLKLKGPYVAVQLSF